MFGNYQGYKYEVRFQNYWSGLIFEPGRNEPHPVIVRGSRDEAPQALITRMRALIDVLRKQSSH